MLSSLSKSKYDTFINTTMFDPVDKYFKSRDQEITKSVESIYSTMSRIKHIILLINENRLRVETANGDEFEFPLVWLKDNCRCEECFDANSQSRTIDAKFFDFSPKADTFRYNENDNTITLIWEDGHESCFKCDWLLERNFSFKNHIQTIKNYHSDKELWGSEISSKTPKFSFPDVIKNDEILLSWIENLEKYGIVLMDQVPQGKEGLKKISEKTAFIRPTHYGYGFELRAKPNAQSQSFTGKALQLHTDFPFYQQSPGVNIMHCISNCLEEGGESYLVDAFHIISQLQEKCPDAYTTLCNTTVDWTDVGADDGKPFRKIHRAPVICHDHEGRLSRVNFNQPQRGSQLGLGIEETEEWYKALGLFVKLMYDEKNKFIYKLQPGESLTFDTNRILHGRCAPKDGLKSDRFLHGYLMDWDEILCTKRTLQHQLGIITFPQP